MDSCRLIANLIVLTLCVISGALLSSCGQTGPLYLPDETEQIGK